MESDLSIKPAAPKRVLMTADTIGGVWTYALELARALEPHGVEVALATMGANLRPEQWVEVASLPNVEVFESTFKLEWMEVPWQDVERAGEWLLQIEERVCPDVIHLNGYAHGCLPWRAPALVVGHSCVLSWWRAVHGQPAPAEWESYRKAVCEGLRAAQIVAAPSRSMRNSLEQNYGQLRRTTVIPNGRRLPGVEPASKEELILSAGRLWDQAKNITALAEIARSVPWPVCIAGDTQPPGTNADTKAPDCSGSLRYLGRLSSAEVAGWFARASIYALPARYEPFGLSVLEAALAGCALVLGDIPSLREIWSDAALFVQPDAPDALLAALLELTHSPAMLADLGARARRLAANYTPEQMALGYLRVYADLSASARLAHRPEALAA